MTAEERDMIIETLSSLKNTLEEVLDNRRT